MLTKNGRTMRIKNVIKIILIAGLMPMAGRLNAQCELIYSGSLCQQMPISFTGAMTGVTHKFNFNGEDSVSGKGYKIDHAFKTPGLKKITYTTTVNGKACSSVLYLTIQPKAVLKYSLRSSDTQCFERNLFCFRDSFYHPNGAGISKVGTTIEDGQYFEFLNPRMPTDFCFSVKDERGGRFRRLLAVEDENGCISHDTSAYFFVYEKIGPRFTRTAASNPGCDSVKANITNISRIAASKVSSVLWTWTDGSRNNTWGPGLSKTFRKNGVYDGTLYLETKTGCRDSYSMKGVAAVVGNDPHVVASADEACFSRGKVTYQLSYMPIGTTSLVWNFGDPASGPSNVSRSLVADHVFSKPGPFQVKVSYSNPACGNRAVFDTTLIIGPLSLIEKQGSRMAEHEVYQCTGGTHDSVHFSNFTLYYHNDNTPGNEDSAVFVNGKRRIFFNSSQQPAFPSGYSESKNRSGANVYRIWDFGDAYALNCTTDIRTNANVNCNCRYSTAEKPVHLYQDWEAVMWRQYKFVSMEEAVFSESTRTCSRIPVYASDSFVVFEDSVLVVPASGYDSMLANGYLQLRNKRFLHEKYFYNGVRTVSDRVDVSLGAGKTATVRKAGGTVTVHTGPATWRLNPGDRISSRDSVWFQLTLSTNRDTLPYPFFKRRFSQPFDPRVTGGYKKTYPGINGQDYIISFPRYTALYNSRIPTAYTAILYTKDTAHPLRCESSITKQIIWMHADAGGIGTGLRTLGQYCPGASSPGFGVTLLLSDLKPGASFSDVRINFDSACGRNNFKSLNTLQPGGLPPGPYFSGYQVYGNVPSSFSYQYSLSELCTKGGCPTIGIIVGNGVSRSGNKPLCADTQWYRNLACFDLADAAVSISANKERNALGVLKICRGDSVFFQHPATNKTKAYTVSTNLYELSTDNAGPNYGKKGSRYVSETYVRNSLLKDSGNGKLYNYLVIARGGQDPVRVKGTFDWTDGPQFLLKKPDTIITAVITKWDTVADVSRAWEQMKARLLEKQFDPYSLDGKTLARLIWNGKGIIGQPASGARGCIDTAGFGHLISFSMQPVPGFTKVLHMRDTSLQPVDSAYIGGKKQPAYTLRTLHNGYYLAKRSITTRQGCPQVSGTPVISGFASIPIVPDSIVTADQGTTLTGKMDLRYFHPDPLNSGTWDTYDYWRSPRMRPEDPIHKAPLSRWDWNKADDDKNNPATIFGSDPYGGTGTGSINNPWKALGGGNAGAIYYKQCGIFEMRVINGDSSGCLDTISRNIIVVDHNSKFSTDINIPACSGVAEFMDSTGICDPCRAKGDTCNFIKKWFIDWGDGHSDVFARNHWSAPGLPARVKHNYKENGWKRIRYVTTNIENGEDSFARWVFIPGPRPSFEFVKTASNEITVNQYDSVAFRNTSDSASVHADFTWFFGDGAIRNTKDSIVRHQFTMAGDFYVFIEQYDSLVRRPSIRKFCPAVYPDTSVRPGMIVHVMPFNAVHVTPSGRRIYGYPNPVLNAVSIRGSEAKSAEIIQVSGRSSGVFPITDGQLDLSALPSGVYLIRSCEQNGECWQLRVVKI